jgi:predicted alpha/beta-hydrolase family hydrolase
MRLSLAIAAYTVSGAMMAACSSTPQGSQALAPWSAGAALAVTRDTAGGPLSCGGKPVGKPQNVMITDSNSKDRLIFLHNLSYLKLPGFRGHFPLCGEGSTNGQETSSCLPLGVPS